VRTQTKCTLTLCTMFIIEILPIPFTAIYSIYAVRKRPTWIPNTVERLYVDKPINPNKVNKEISVDGHDPMKTRRNCTIALTTMFLIDVIVPFTVPFGLYIVRRRPIWFKNVVTRLYADHLQQATQDEAIDDDDISEPSEILSEILDQRFRELEQKNFDFARTVQKKGA